MNGKKIRLDKNVSAREKVLAWGKAAKARVLVCPFYQLRDVPEVDVSFFAGGEPNAAAAFRFIS